MVQSPTFVTRLFGLVILAHALAALGLHGLLGCFLITFILDRTFFTTYLHTLGGGGGGAGALSA